MRNPTFTSNKESMKKWLNQKIMVKNKYEIKAMPMVAANNCRYFWGELDTAIERDDDSKIPNVKKTYKILITVIKKENCPYSETDKYEVFSFAISQPKTRFTIWAKYNEIVNLIDLGKNINIR